MRVDDGTISVVEELPDGRQLVVVVDDRGVEQTVVAGRASVRPHPVPGCEWLPARRRRAPRVRIARPARTDRPVGMRPDTPGIQRARAEDRATELLESLLSVVQLRQWRATRTFWVDTPRGPVQLGRLYQLLHFPKDRPDTEEVLCVVPRLHSELPLSDIWVNLLLMLRARPERFFAVAVVRTVRPRHARASRPG